MMRRSVLPTSSQRSFLTSLIQKRCLLMEMKQNHRFLSLLSAKSPSSSSQSIVHKAKSPSFSSSQKWYHSTAHESLAASPAPRDTRLAGRRRFYKKVGIMPISPPWQQQPEEQQEGNDDNTVDSPITAGVDNTPAGGSGIHQHTLPSPSSMQSLLLPNTPGHHSPPHTQPNNSWYTVTLDNKILRTPLGTPLSLPSSTLALAIASEWDAQTTTITPAQMPLTTLACTTLDQTTANPSIPIQTCLNFLPNDTTCYHADPLNDRILYKKQMKAWDGLHDWVSQHLKHEPAVALGTNEGLLMSRARQAKDKRVGLPHPDELMKNARVWMESLDAWHLTALASVCSEAKSFLIGMALISSSSHISSPPPSSDDDDHGKQKKKEVAKSPFAGHTAKAVEASRVEEEFQIECWGLVEGGHDYDRLNCSIQIHAAQFLCTSLISEDEL